MSAECTLTAPCIVWSAGESCLHILAVNRREEELIRLVELAHMSLRQGAAHTVPNSSHCIECGECTH